MLREGNKPTTGVVVVVVDASESDSDGGSAYVGICERREERDARVLESRAMGSEGWWWMEVPEVFVLALDECEERRRRWGLEVLLSLLLPGGMGMGMLEAAGGRVGRVKRPIRSGGFLLLARCSDEPGDIL